MKLLKKYIYCTNDIKNRKKIIILNDLTFFFLNAAFTSVLYESSSFFFFEYIESSNVVNNTNQFIRANTESKKNIFKNCYNV